MSAAERHLRKIFILTAGTLHERQLKADFLYSVRISDCNRLQRQLFQSMNLPTLASVG